jgi:hypothetical protein
MLRSNQVRFDVNFISNPTLPGLEIHNPTQHMVALKINPTQPVVGLSCQIGTILLGLKKKEKK